MKDFIELIKMYCAEIHALMAGVDAQKVLHSMRDPYGRVLQKQTEEIERSLEMCMPDKELPRGEEMIQMVSNVEPITTKAKELLISLMDHTAEVYFQAAQVAEKFSALAQSCTPNQLMVLM